METPVTNEAPAGAVPANTPLMRELGASRRGVDATRAVLERWFAEQDKTPLDRAAQAVLRMRADLNSKERRWTSEASFGTARLLARQRALLSFLHEDESPAALATLWQREDLLLHGAEDPELAEALAKLPDEGDPARYLRVTLSFPDPFAGALEQMLGKDASRAAAAFNTQAPLALRLNPLRVSLAQAISALPGARAGDYSPWCILMPARANLHDVPAFRAGWFEVQEEASQLSALLTNAMPGQTIVDVGAGAGGKSLAIAALMRGRGSLIAVDSSAERMRQLSIRARRAGVSAIAEAVVTADAEGDWGEPFGPGGPLTSLEGAADTVLVDAPCTGSGVLRRNPDARWREAGLAAAIRLQRALMRQSARMVRPGGTLIYVTCAFERSQNESVVEAFLESMEGRDFRLVSGLPALVSACARAEAAATEGLRSRRVADPEPPKGAAKQWQERLSGLFDESYMRTWPHLHGTDAFFAACLKRKPTG